MTERFNFYDVYGYLIPGLTFVSLLWLPIALTAPEWPSVEWSSAFVVLVAAYISGFVISRLTEYFVPTGKRAARVGAAPGNRVTDDYRKPSDLLLDYDPARQAGQKVFGSYLSDPVRVSVTEGLRVVFGLDVGANLGHRQDAFFLCRRFLQAMPAHVASYSEQFQGLYTFCLTTASVLMIVAYYDLAWAAAAWAEPRFGAMPELIGIVLTVLSLIGLMVFHRDRNAYVFLVAAIGSLGLLLGGRGGVPERMLPPLLLLAIASGTLAFPLFAAYRYFSGVFAATTYRDFYTMLAIQARQDALARAKAYR